MRLDIEAREFLRRPVDHVGKRVGVQPYGEQSRGYGSPDHSRHRLRWATTCVCVARAVSPGCRRTRSSASVLPSIAGLLALCGVSLDYAANNRPEETPNGQRPQSHHHLRRHRLDPHALDVAASADHGERDRGRGHRRGRGRRGHRAPARPQPQGRPTRPVAGGVRAVPQGDQAALQLRGQHHHRRGADHDGGGARASPPPPSSRRWPPSTWAP